jgi:phage/plasmid-like protein (TIGR03299 family)
MGTTNVQKPEIVTMSKAYGGGFNVSERTAPWDHVGVEVLEPGVSIERALELTNCNAMVEKRPLYTVDSVVGTDGHPVLIPVEDKVAIVRTADNKPVGTVGRRYEIVQTKDAFGFMDILVGNGQANIVRAGELAGGKKMFMVAQLDPTYIAGDEISDYIILTTGHELGIGVGVIYTKVRVTCQNALNVAIDEAYFYKAIMHSSKTEERIREAAETIEFVAAYNHKFNGTMNQMLLESYSKAKYALMVNRLIEIPVDASKAVLSNREEARELAMQCWMVDDLNNVRETKYGAFQAIVDFCDHRPARHKNLETKMRSIVVGDSHRMKQKAFNHLIGRTAKKQKMLFAV